jgi:hypothetical protein
MVAVDDRGDRTSTGGADHSRDGIIRQIGFDRIASGRRRPCFFRNRRSSFGTIEMSRDGLVDALQRTQDAPPE